MPVYDHEPEETVAFPDDDSFDLEITRDFLIEYRKNFWGTRRTGKIMKYQWDKMEEVQFGSPVNRLIFSYMGRRGGSTFKGGKYGDDEKPF